MKCAKNSNGGYTLELDRNDTFGWAHRERAAWPNSGLSDRRIKAVVDRNGLTDLEIDGRHPAGFYFDAFALDAMIADHLPNDLRHLWPTWEKATAGSALATA